MVQPCPCDMLTACKADAVEGQAAEPLQVAVLQLGNATQVQATQRCKPAAHLVQSLQLCC